MEEEEVPHTPPQEEGNEGEAPHQPEEAEPEDLKSSISPKRTIRIKKKIHKPEKEEGRKLDLYIYIYIYV